MPPGAIGSLYKSSLHSPKGGYELIVTFPSQSSLWRFQLERRSSLRAYFIIRTTCCASWNELFLSVVVRARFAGNDNRTVTCNRGFNPSLASFFHLIVARLETEWQNEHPNPIPSLAPSSAKPGALLLGECFAIQYNHLWIPHNTFMT